MANWWEIDAVQGEGNGLAHGKPDPDYECPPGEKRKPTQDGWTCVPDNNKSENDPHNCPAGTSWNAAENRCIAGDCPTGQTWHSPLARCIPKCPGTDYHDTQGNCQKDSPSNYPGKSGGSSGSSGGGGAAPQAPPRTVSPYDAALSKTLFEQLQAMINGEGQPFSPEVVSKMNAGLLGSNKAQLEGSQQDLQKRLIASGLSRSGVAPAAHGRLRSSADASLSDGFRKTAITAIQGNYAAKAQALGQAQTFLNSERANALSTDQLTFGYAQLAQQWKALQAQFDQQKWLANNGNEQDLLRLLLQLQNGGLQ